MFFWCQVQHDVCHDMGGVLLTHSAPLQAPHPHALQHALTTTVGSAHASHLLPLPMPLPAHSHTHAIPGPLPLFPPTLAGATHGQALCAREMDAVIAGCGRPPLQRTTLYGAAAVEQVERSYEERPLAPLEMGMLR